MNEHPTKEELLKLVLTHRDDGALTPKFLKKIRKQALALMWETKRGDFVDLDLTWIGRRLSEGEGAAGFSSLSRRKGEGRRHRRSDGMCAV